MTREETIKMLKEKRQTFIEEWADIDDIVEAIDMAISALSADGDLISRADAIEAVEETLSGNVYWDYVCDAVKALKALPSADRPIGEWSEQKYSYKFGTFYVCSECLKCVTEKSNFCPICGARMIPYKGGDSE